MDKLQKSNNQCFEYAVTILLNNEEIKKDLQRITKIKPFISKYNWEGINSEINDWKKIEKNNSTTALNVYMLKMKKYIQPTFQDITKIVKNKFFNDFKQKRMVLSCSKKNYQHY